VHVVNYSLFNIVHHYSCFAQLTAVSPYTLQYTGSCIASLINISYNHPYSNVILWNAKQQYVHDIWDQTKSHHFTHNFSIDTWHSTHRYSNSLTASRQQPNFTLVCSPSLGTFSFILDLADDQLIDHTTHYHVADLDSSLPGLVKPFITSLRLYLSHAYIRTSSSSYINDLIHHHCYTHIQPCSTWALQLTHDLSAIDKFHVYYNVIAVLLCAVQMSTTRCTTLRWTDPFLPAVNSLTFSENITFTPI